MMNRKKGKVRQDNGQDILPSRERAFLSEPITRTVWDSLEVAAESDDYFRTLESIEKAFGVTFEQKEEPTDSREDLTHVLRLDTEEASLRGYIALDKLKESIQLKLKDGLEIIDLSGNGCCTDAAIKILTETLSEKDWNKISEIRLKGCFLLTDVCIAWLTNMPAKCLALKLVDLSGCCNITNSGVIALTSKYPQVNVNALGTGITNSFRNVVSGSSKFPVPADQAATNNASLIFLPHKDVKMSFANYLKDKSTKTLGNYHNMTIAMDDWTMNISEIADNIMYEPFLSSKLSQVILLFDIKTDINEIQRHVSQSIVRVLNKQTLNPSFVTNHLESSTGDGILHCHKLHLEGNGVLSSYDFTAETEGLYTAATPFRQNKCFEVKCLGCGNSKIKIGTVSGPPKSDYSAFTKPYVLEVGSTYSLEAINPWNAQCTPLNATHAGLTLKINGKSKETIEVNSVNGLYPLVIISGDPARVKIKDFGKYVTCPDQMVDVEYKTKSACDSNGLITKWRGSTNRSLVMSNVDVGRRHNTITIKCLEVGAKANIALGIGRATYVEGDQPGWRHNSIGYHGDDGLLYHNSGSGLAFGETWKKNDEIRMHISGFKSDFLQNGDTVDIEWFKNGQLAGKKTSFTYKSDERCVFMIGLHSKGQKVQIMNYYHTMPKLEQHLDKLTLGRCFNYTLTDDGTLRYRKGQTTYASFISKTPISKHLPYFEATVVGLEQVHQHMSIGLGPAVQPYNRMVGWDTYTIGLHADNGKIYKEAGSGLTSPIIEYGKNDVVGCGIDIAKAKFDEGGFLIPQQELSVYFTVNGKKRVENLKVRYETDGLYPSFSSHFDGDVIRLHNFSTLSPTTYSEPEDNISSETSIEDGCHFIAVGLGKGDNKKSSQINQALSVSKLIDSSSLDSSLVKLQKNVNNLNRTEQQNYSQLAWQKSNLVKFSKSTSRLTVFSIDLASDQCDIEIKKLKETIVNHEKTYSSLHHDVYKISDQLKTDSNSVLTTLKQSQLIKTSLNMDIITHLQHKGSVVYLPGWKQKAMLYPTWLENCLNVLKNPGDKVGSRATCVEQETLAWTQKQLFKLIPSQNDSLEEMLPYLGIIKIPCLRIKHTDEHFLYTLPQYILSDNNKIAKFVSGNENMKDMFIVERTYTLNNPITSNIFIHIINRASNYSCILVLNQSTAVFQNGAVQTIIEANEENIKLESRCYCPVTGLNEAAIPDVQEYTANIFYLFTDYIDGIMNDLQISPSVRDNVPPTLVNTSIGCQHDWDSRGSGKARTSVCTLCNQCCDKGRACPWSGIVGDSPSLCNCQTNIYGCQDCGICKTCANDLWTLKSVLRPCCDVTVYGSKDKGHNSSFPLNGQTYNEFTCVALASNVPVCLKLFGDTSEQVIQVYPGPAVEIETQQDLEKYNQKVDNYQSLMFDPGNELNITLHAVQQLPGSVDLEAETKPLEIKPVYFGVINREVRICHETGILCYETKSNSVPVGQFVGPKALTPDCNRFSFKVINEGVSRYIAIGLVHQRYRANRQPGWDSNSCGYHADDGGVFTGSGAANSRLKKYHKGDIVACEFDFDISQYKFYLNDELVYTSKNCRIPPGGFYPAVGFHSREESVQLLEKEPWELAADLVMQSLPVPISFDTYKYGNLWISPGAVLNMISSRSRSSLSGWLLLFNPSRGTIAYIIHLKEKRYGTLGPRENFTQSVSTEGMDVEIEWFTVDTGRTYTEEAIKNEYSKRTGESRFFHRLSVNNMSTTSVTPGMNRLLKTSTPCKPSIGYSMDVKVNGILQNSFWLKRGKYQVYIPVLKGRMDQTTCIVRNPKFPTFDYPNCFQRGMTVIADLQQNGEVYTECVINDVINGGKTLMIEYNNVSADGTESECLQVDVKSMMIQLANVKTEMIESGGEPIQGQDQVDNAAPTKKVMLEQLVADVKGNDITLGKPMLKKRGYIPAPFYLVTKDSQRVMELGFDSRWKENLLITKATCKNIPTRLTVQGLQQVEAVAEDDNFNQNMLPSIKTLAIYLPSGLNANNLSTPSAVKMFSDVQLHLLCNPGIPEMEEFKGVFNPHLVDMPPSNLQKKLSADELYGNVAVGIAYTQLTARRVWLSTYEQFFSGGKSDLTEEKIQTLLYNLLKMYTSLCHIYTEFYGELKLSNLFISQQQDNLEANISEIKHIVDVKTMKEPSNHALIKLPNDYYVCNAHLLSQQGYFQDKVNEATMDFKHYDPYSKAVNTFARQGMIIKKIPDEFFTKLSNLQILHLTKCKLLEVIPEGLSKSLQLKTLTLVNLPKIKSLPSDIFMSPSLEYLEISQVPVKVIPSKFLETSKLTVLILRSMGLTSIPDEIGNLLQLNTLILNYNPITDLPMSLGKLRNLTDLDIDGMSLLEYESGFNADDLMNWFNTKASFYINYLGEEVVQTLFKKFDINNSGTLDVNEVANLNNYLFWQVPRLGSNDINNEEYGGIPPCVFLLMSLEHLSLKNQAITAVPVHMCRLTNLANLDLASDPLLESLPGALGHLPNIKSINLFRCPSLRTPPNEVVQRGFESVQAYLKRLAGGFTECRRTKLMLVGLGGAGKTSLLKAIMSVNNKTVGTKGEQITDGIDIQPWTIKTKDNIEVTYSTWDFAGQTLYYNTHQFFLSKRAIYVLVWSTRQGFEHAGLDFWLSSICCHAPKTPIFIVGSHCDQVPKADIAMNELRKLYPQIIDFYFVSSITGMNIKELKDDMLRVTLEQKNMGEKIPKVWLNLEKKFLEARKDTSIMEWSKIRQYGMEEGIYDEKDIKEAIQFLHELGTVQFFDNDVLRDRVVINPQWIVNVMSCVVSVKSSPIQAKRGEFHHSDMKTIWNEYPTSLHQWLLQLTEQFDLTFPLPHQDINIVPCLLPHEEPKQAIETVWPSNDDLKKKGKEQSKMVYRFSYLPAGLFNRCQVRLFQFSNGKSIWKRGSMLNKNNHLALIRQISESELEIQVCGQKPANIIFLVHEIIEGLIEESFHGVVYDFLVPCPDCVVKEGTLDPCLFDSDLVTKAKDHKAPFLQCRKYFHTISMSHLEETLPSNSTTDFDANLQRSIIMMQELNTEMSKDVTILYSASDMPTDKETGDKINPKWLKDDLEKAGHSCWFNSDMKTVGINELTLALKNCKVVLALISDNFERDEKCRDLLLYTIDGLTKQYVIAPIGNSLAWFKTDLGMRIGQQEQMIMIKSKQRYAEKLPELKEAIADKLAGIVKTELKDHPECFLSYCWANSHDAVEKGSKKIKGALGDYDPRAIKKYLTDKGINVWLDYEQTTVNRGLYDNISKGLRHAKVVVACVSDEYVNSKNCMMELRFAVLTLNLPIVLAIVGTGREWKVSEVGILQQRSNSAKVYLQKQNESALDTLCSFVKERLPTAAEKLQIEATKVKKDITEIHQQVAKQQKNNVSYQEERELVQRKFMRHIVSFISRMDQTPMPRLIVLDIEKTTSSTGRGKKLRRPVSARKTIREKTQINTDVDKEIDVDDIWDEDGLCIKMMCEYEEGWHVCDKSYHFKRSDSAKEQLKNMSPYLGRLYAIARQSHINLTCISNTCNNGEKFVSWVEQESKDHTDFVQGFQTLRSILIEDNSDQMIAFLDQLVRCHLPSGKIYWLCEKHQKMPRITKLSTGTGGSSETFKNLYQEDILLKEYMEKSDIYKQKKAQLTKTPRVVLPSQTESENRSASKPGPIEEPLADKKASNTTDKKTKDVKAESSKEKDPVKRTKSKTSFKAAADVVEVTNAAEKTIDANDKNTGKKSSTATQNSSKTCTVQ